MRDLIGNAPLAESAEVAMRVADAVQHEPRKGARLLGLLAAALITLFPGLSACAAGSGGMPGYTVSQQRLNELLARQFPVTRNLLGGLADLTLSSPRLGLLPASNPTRGPPWRTISLTTRRC